MKILVGPSVLPGGIGRKDYSQGVQRSVQPVVANRTPRITWNITYVGLPTLVYPNFYAQMPMIFYDEHNNLVNIAPKVPYHIFELAGICRTYALVFIGFYKFASMADFLLWNPERWYGDFYAYGRATFRLTTGIKTEEGKLYSVAFSVWSDKPTFDFTIDQHGIEEDAKEYLP